MIIVIEFILSPGEDKLVMEMKTPPKQEGPKRHTTISAFLSADNICSSDGEANEATSAQVSRFWKFLCFNNQVKFGEVNV